MKIVRFEVGGKCYFGKEENEEFVVLKTDKLEAVLTAPCGEVFSKNQVNLLPPCQPEKIICLGLNYRNHAEEVGLEIPKFPIVFMKPASAIVGSGAEVIYPNDLSRRLDYEGEFVVVIGSVCKNLAEAEVRANLSKYVLGYTCGNDITARDLQPKNGQWTVAKSFDTFMPIGPVIVTDIDPSNTAIKTILNGKTVQESNTCHFIFDVAYTVSYLSNIMTLNPGDIISTGTPSGIGAMLADDVVEVEIEKIGKLTNTVKLKYPERGYKPRKASDSENDHLAK